MTDRAFEYYDGAPLGANGRVRLLTTRALPGMVMLASSAVLGVWMIYFRPAQAPVAPFPPTASQVPAANPFGELAVLNVEASLQGTPFPDSSASPDGKAVGLALGNVSPWGGMFPVNTYGALAELRPLASHETLGLRPTLDLDLESGVSAAENQIALAPTLVAPLPPRRPVDLGVGPPPPPEPSPSVASAPAQNGPGFFEKLFSGIHMPSAPQGQSVAYASAETTTVSRSTPQSAILRSVAPSWGSSPGALSRYDKFTAVYDIAARTVYLPDGRRLEAHSGLGDLKDDPKHVDARARGATPPDVYDLTPREGLFHGIQALRLKPVGSGEQFGRTGLLAHPYMLGPDGDSFGCVSFKDYDAFLNAFQSGQVKKLAVVAKLD